MADAGCEVITTSCCSRNDTCKQANLTDPKECPFVSTCEDRDNDSASGFTCSKDDRTHCRKMDADIIYNCPSNTTTYPACAQCAQRGFKVLKFGPTKMCTGAKIHPKYSALCPYTVKTDFNQTDEVLGTGLSNAQALERCTSFCNSTLSRAVCIPRDDKPTDYAKYDQFPYACVLRDSKRDDTDTDKIPNATENSCLNINTGGAAAAAESAIAAANSAAAAAESAKSAAAAEADASATGEGTKDKPQAGPGDNIPKPEDTSQSKRDAFCSAIESQSSCDSAEGRRCKWNMLYLSCDSNSVQKEATAFCRALDSAEACLAFKTAPNNRNDASCTWNSVLKQCGRTQPPPVNAGMCAEMTPKGIAGCDRSRGCKWNSYGESCSPSWQVDLIVSAIVLVPLIVFIALVVYYQNKVEFVPVVKRMMLARAV